jgi:protein-tyrosine-phosphatase/DNA-binding transcriptional ArsR family regulator
MEVSHRARAHAALGDPHRLRIIDALALGDRTFQELAAAADLPGNAAAHHLAVLESAELIDRRASDGDRRRRYISLRHERLRGLVPLPELVPGMVLFVCTHNSARSQFAAALWQRQTGRPADSAGTSPANRVHPLAMRTAAEFDLDLSGAAPKGYGAATQAPDLVVSVCDRAHESDLPFAAPTLHWSVPDPVRTGTRAAFRSAFAEIAERVDRLATATVPATHPGEATRS